MRTQQRRGAPFRTGARAACGGVLIALFALIFAGTPAIANPLDDEGLAVEITDMSPGVLRPDGEVVIEGTVTNNSAQTLERMGLELLMQRPPMSTRDEVDAWLDGHTSSEFSTAAPYFEVLEVDLEPGEVDTFEIVLPSSPTFAETSLWGPRGIEVTASGQGLRGADRNLLLWFPTESPLMGPADLSVLVPLTPTTAEWQDALAQDIPVAQSAAERLEGVIEAADGSGVTWAVDPALLETDTIGPHQDFGVVDPDADPEQDPEQTETPDPEETGTADADEGTPPDSDDDGAGDDGSADDATGNGNGTEDNTDDADTDPDTGGTAGTDGTEALPADGQNLQGAITDAARGSDVVQLAYANADVSALFHANGMDLWRMGNDRGAALLDEAQIESLPGVHWPAGVIDNSTLNELVGGTTDAVIADEQTLPVIDPAASPLSTTALVGTEDGTRALVYDHRISSLLAGHSPYGEDLDELTIRQKLLADSAALVREFGETGLFEPGFLAAFPHDVTAEQVQANLEELAQAPWIEMTNLSGLLEGPELSARDSPPPQLDDESRLPAGQLQELTGAYDEVQHIADTIESGELLTEGFQPSVLTALSAAWSTDQRGRIDLLRSISEQSSAIDESISVELGSDVLLINHSGDLPVTVSNDLPVPATVTVRLEPHDPRLRAPEDVEVVLEPDSITTARVPMQAVANGNVPVDVTVLNGPDGDTVGQAATFTIRVRADWEDIGTVSVAALLGVAFIFGLIRTIRSGRRDRIARGTEKNAEAAS